MSVLAKSRMLCHRAAVIRKILLIACAGLLAVGTPLHAQNPATAADPADTAADESKKKDGESAGPQRFWQAKLSGGHYMVALERISSVSRHKYALDGTVIVDEVTVDTVGQALVRFYFISPITDTANNTLAGVAQRGKEMIDRAAELGGTNVPNMVIKKYPETTHARTVEYRMNSAADLNQLYSSVRNAWETNRGRVFTAK